LFCFGFLVFVLNQSLSAFYFACNCVVAKSTAGVGCGGFLALQMVVRSGLSVALISDYCQRVP